MLNAFQRIDGLAPNGIGADKLNRMPNQSPTAPLPLADALIEWSDPKLLAEVREEEQRLKSKGALKSCPYTTDSILAGRTNPSRANFNINSIRDLVDLEAAWERLFAAFRRMIELQMVTVTGVRTNQQAVAREPIPPTLASQLQVDPASGSVSLGMGGPLWTAVQITFRPPDQQPSQPGDHQTVTNGRPRGLTKADIDTLTPEDVIALLIRHATDVASDTGINLVPPGVASLVGLVAQKMRLRAEAGEMRQVLAEEAKWLSAYAARVAKAAETYVLLKPKAIENKLGPLHRNLKTKSPAR